MPPPAPVPPLPSSAATCAPPYYGTGTLTGKGQNLGLFEYLGTDLADLNTYYKNIGQTLPLTPVLLSTDGTSTRLRLHQGQAVTATTANKTST